MTWIPALRALLTPGFAEEAFGSGARVDHVRFKPGQSLVGRLTVPGEAPRWVASYTPEFAVKERNLLRRAAGHDLGRAPVPAAFGRGSLVTGPIVADPRLGPVLRGAAGGADRNATATVTVLNYNPLRRLVRAVRTADGAPEVHRTWVTPPPVTVPMLLALRAAGVPTPAPRTVDDHTTAVVHVPGGDLAERFAAEHGALGDRSADATPVAEALTGLHRADLREFTLPTYSGEDASRALEAVRRTLGSAAPRLVEDFDAVVGRVLGSVAPDFTDGDGPARAPVVLHGDFSADQVLGAPDDPTLIDFDRLRLGPAGYDLGCFLAVELLAGRGSARAGALAEAYDGPTPGKVRAWAAFHVLLRALEPFRDLDPAFEARILDRLHLADALALTPTRLRVH